MIVTDPKQIDLTGADPAYKRNLRRFKIFKGNQIVELDDAAYLNTLKVYEVIGVDENNNPSLKSLKQGSGAKEWNTDDTCIDVTAISVAKFRYGYQAPTWTLSTDQYFQEGVSYYYRVYSDDGVYTDENNKKYNYALYPVTIPGSAVPSDITLYLKNQATWDYTLVNKFFMNDSDIEVMSSGEYEIAVEYNALEIECSAIDRDGLGPEYSPGLMRSVLDKVEELYYVRNPINNASATTVADMHCLAEDLTGCNPDNLVSGEVHHIDVPNNLFVIRPQCGSFYNTDTLKLEFQEYLGSETYGETVVLKKDVDYVVTGINTEKTAISEPSCGVYEYIVIKQAYVGKVLITYQAFGGDVTQADINALKDIIQSVYRTLTAMDIVTLSNISDVALIREIIYRQELLEQTVRHYQSQRFKYTTGTTDKWVNLAFVDRNPWTADAPVPTGCIGEFRITIQDAGYYADIRVTYNLNEDIQLEVSSVHADVPSYEQDALNYFTKRILPKFRAIWCTADWTVDADNVRPGTDRGVMLQLSITSTDPTFLTIKIDDLTGAKSPWDLVDTLGEERPSKDNTTIEYYTNTEVRYGTFVLVDGKPQYIFDWKSTIDYTSNVVALCPNNYTIFAGSIPIIDIDAATLSHWDPETGELPTSNNGYRTAVPVITGTDVDLSQVKSVIFKIYDAFDDKYLYGRSIQVKCQNNTLIAGGMYFLEDMCMVSCGLDFDETSGYTMRLYARTGTNSLNNDRFSLVQIDLVI